MGRSVFGLFLLLLTMDTMALAQIHLQSMRLFIQDVHAPVINVYDIKTESLIKSLNTGEKMTQTLFSSDRSKLYATGIQKLCIIDVNTLDIEVIELLSEDQAYHYIGDNPNRFQKVIPRGISEEGLAVVIDGDDHVVFDAKQGGKKVNTFKAESKVGCYHKGTIYVAGQDGLVRVIDPLTGIEKDRLDKVFDANAISEAQKNSRYDNKFINMYLVPYGNHVLSSVDLGSSVGGTVATMYDLDNRKVMYSERLAPIEYMKLIPVVGISAHRLFHRHEPIDPNIKLPEYPPAPVSPDFDKLKGHEIKKASREYQAKADAYMAKVKEVAAKRKEHAKPENYCARIFSDVNCTQEVMRIDGTYQYLSIYGDLVVVIKDTVCEIYDITTKKLLYTIYLV